jgi:hypothetical protein
MKFRNPD